MYSMQGLWDKTQTHSHTFKCYNTWVFRCRECC